MIKFKKDGFSKTVSSNSKSGLDIDKCPDCQTLLQTERDLYSDDEDCIKFAEKKSSMETTVYHCLKCGKWFVYWETLDYDYFHLKEIEALP